MPYLSGGLGLCQKAVEEKALSDSLEGSECVIWPKGRMILSNIVPV